MTSPEFAPRSHFSFHTKCSPPVVHADVIGRLHLPLKYPSQRHRLARIRYERPFSARGRARPPSAPRLPVSVFVSRPSQGPPFARPETVRLAYLLTCPGLFSRRVHLGCHETRAISRFGHYLSVSKTAPPVWRFRGSRFLYAARENQRCISAREVTPARSAMITPPRSSMN